MTSSAEGKPRGACTRAGEDAAARADGREAPSRVVFHRHYRQFRGGHLKVFHYFEHVRSSPSYDARIRFSSDSVWDASNPWWGLPETVIGPQQAENADVLFLAGIDWRSLEPGRRAASRVPIVNLMQDFRATRPGAPLHEFLAHRAIRVCVTPEIAQALRDIGTVPGPILTVPVGIDLDALPAPRPAGERDIDCVVLAVKDAKLGGAIAGRLRAGGHRVLLVDRSLPREQLLAAMARARVAVHLPASIEGAYMPALESMALGALVVCPDCLGNRSFCRDGETCLVPKRSARAIVKATLTALAASPEELEPMLAAARRESAEHALARERSRFLAVLDRVDELWAAD